MNLLTLVPPSLRQVVYLVYALAGVALGSIASADFGHEPHWLVPAVMVFAYVGSAFGITAHANVFTGAGTDTPDPSAIADLVASAVADAAAPADQPTSAPVSAPAVVEHAPVNPATSA